MFGLFGNNKKDKDFFNKIEKMYFIKKDLSANIYDELGITTFRRAVSDGHYDIADFLLDKGVDINAIDEYGDTALGDASSNGHTDKVKFLLDRGADVNVIDKSGNTALMKSLLGKDEDTAIFLLNRRDIDVNIIDKNGYTALSWAFHLKYTNVIKLILEKVADINAIDKDGNTILIKALSENNNNIVSFLLDKGADINATNKNGATALMYESIMGRKDSVKFLLDEGADINAINKNGATALMLALHNNHKEIVEFLLEEGADVNIIDKDGRTALIYALSCNKYGETPLINSSEYFDRKTVKFFLEKVTDVNVANREGDTALMLALRKNYKDTVRFLFDKGADINITKDGDTALKLALDYCYKDLVEFLLDKGADINVTDKDGHTALEWAFLHGYTDIIKLLLEKVVDINAIDKDENTILIQASTSGNKDIVKFLLEKGADVNSKDKYGNTALSEALKRGHKEIVETLLEKGADVNGDIALLKASEKGYKEIVEILLENGADVNSKDKSADTALLKASLMGHKEIVEILLENGADVNSKDKSADTALSKASLRGDKEIVEILLKNGADVNSKDKSADTALSIASKMGHKKIVEILLEKGADVESYTKIINMFFGHRIGTIIEAVEKNHIDIVEFLLEKGADINVKDQDGNTLLNLAIQNKNQEIIELLISRDININAEEKTLLVWAVKNNNKKIIELLISKGANINAEDEEGLTPLEHAISNNNLETTEFLISKGAESKGILLFALEQNNRALIQLLLNAEDTLMDLNIQEQLLKHTMDLSHNFDKKIKLLELKRAKEKRNLSVSNLFIKSDNGKDVLRTGYYEYARDFHMKLNKMEKRYIEFQTDTRTFIFNLFQLEFSEYLEEKLLDKLPRSDYKKIFSLLLKSNVTTVEERTNIETPLIYAATHGFEYFFNELLKHDKEPIFKKLVNQFTLSGYETIKFELDKYDITQLGINLYYKTDFSKHFTWEDKVSEVKKELALESIELIDEQNSTYLIKVYNNSKEAKLIKLLTIEGKKTEFVNFFENNHTTYLLFKNIPGVTMDSWKAQKILIEDLLKLPVNFEKYDHSHELWGQFGTEELILIKESNISVLPDKLGIGGIYNKTTYEYGIETIYFRDVSAPEDWIDNKSKVIEMIGKRVNLEIDGSSVLLKEAMEESIPKLLELKDSKGNFPKLEKVREDGENRIYFYTFLPELDLNEWKEKSRKTNFKTLFNEPDRVYKLDIYDKTNEELYDENFSTKQYIVLHEYAKIPSKEELNNVVVSKEFKKDNIFWGYSTGSIKYYTLINQFPHMLIIGASGSGKSNFINGVLLSLLNSADKIKKMYLIDLKSGIEFNRYRDLKSDKIDVFSRGTKPSKLLAALYEVEAEMYLREEYMLNNNITKMDQDPIFVIIDEFAQINLMHARGDEMRAKDEINDTLIRIATRARSANIKLVVQTQDPRSVGDDLKVHLMSRALLKTAKEMDKEFTLQNPEMMDEQGIKHTKFDKGRYVFEDYNDGDTKFNELQFPFIDPSLDLHMKYISLVQEHNEENESMYNQYKDYLREEYDYLAKTKLLSNDDNLEKDETPKQEIKSASTKIENTSLELPIDDFDFDAFLLDDESIDEFAEIDNTNKDALKLLKELQGENN